MDIVQSQIQIAAGMTLPDLKLSEETIEERGCAIQLRVTTENPLANFQPDHGIITAYRPGEGTSLFVRF